MALGEKLRNARLNAKLTTAQVAAATCMKVQIVEDIEREDFRRVAAPIYGKGFIRLYAERVGLDPVPLVEEYMGRFVNPVPVQLVTEKGHVLQPSKKLEPLAPHQLDSKALPDMPKEQDLFSMTQRTEIVPPSVETPVRAERSLAADDETDSEGFFRKAVIAVKRRMSDLKEQVKSINDPWRKKDFSLPVIRFVESPVKWLSVLFGALLIIILLFSTMSRIFHRTQPQSSAPRIEETRVQLRLAAEPPAPYIE